MGAKKPTVLAIDDNQDNLTTLQAVLRDALPQITLLTASDGPQGLKLAAAEDPDVILLDIVMPGMDGFAVCRKLKASESLQSIPVIFLTARRTDKKSRIEAIEAGVEGFLTKPLDEIELVAQIQAMVKIRAANRLQEMEKEALAALVSERTRKLENELTERKKTEQALQESEGRYRGLYHSIRDAILVSDTDRNIIDCNPAFTALFGYARAEILGQQIRIVYENKAGFVRLGKALQAHDGNRPFLKTVNYKKKTGEIFPGETSVFYLKDDQGQVTGFIGLIRDITERQQAQQLLQESEEKFKKTFYTSPDSVNINRLDDGMYISINSGFTQITGYSEADVIGKTSLEINIWDNPEDRNTLVAGLKKSGAVQNLEAKFRMKDGHCVYGLMSAAVIDLQGVPHIVSVTRDINERKQNEQALRESEERFRGLYENATIGLYRTTPDGRILLANPALVQMLGYSSIEELRHRNLNQEGFEGGYSRSEFMARVEREGKIAGLESAWKRRDGRVIYIRESARVSRDEKGRVQYYEGTVEDITEGKLSMEALHRSLEGTVQVISRAVEARDPYTAGHERRVAELAYAIGQQMELAVALLEGIRMGALVHDIGKINLPAEILNKPTRLSALEYGLIKTHPQVGYDILLGIEFPWPIAEIVYQHHERVDGSGYPQGLQGDAICLEAKIVAVADVVEAMFSHRPYRPGLGIDKALGELQRGRDQQYNPEVVDACLQLFKEDKFSWASEA